MMEADSIQLRCLNGPCQQSIIDAPMEVLPGYATAVRWTNIKGSPRYAVYVVVEHQGRTGLLYLKSYEKPYQAEQRVRHITRTCAGKLVS
jgi:hypothetical protein